MMEPKSRSEQTTPDAPNARSACLINRASVRVRYAETDRMGIAYNAHYLTWFEVGRTEFMRESGLSYREVEDKGVTLPLVESQVKLRRPIEYDDKLVVETTLFRLRSRMVEFHYCIKREGVIMAEGSTVHACTVATKTNRVKSAKIPQWLENKFLTMTSEAG